MRRPTYSEVASTLALFIALGGTSYAVTSLPADSVGTAQLKNASITAAKLHAHAVHAAAVAADSLTGKQIKESSLGIVPRAASANSATTADSATTAKSAATATNATMLGGAAAATYLDSCPSDMRQSKDLCYEPDLRAATDYRTALQTCSLAGRRLPSIGDDAEAFNALGAPQSTQWTDGFYFDGVSALGVTISEDVNRQMNFGSTAFGSPMPYRCVAGASN